jgi:hypothetical protein
MLKELLLQVHATTKKSSRPIHRIPILARPAATEIYLTEFDTGSRMRAVFLTEIDG